MKDTLAVLEQNLGCKRNLIKLSQLVHLTFSRPNASKRNEKRTAVVGGDNESGDKSVIGPGSAAT